MGAKAKRACATALLIAVSGFAGGCDADFERAEPRGGELVAPPSVKAVPAPLPAAHCSVDVTGIGTLDLEADYLPQVIFCENNGANFEALKAQAIAARSVAYYNMETQGSICDSQGCQVFTCNGTAGDIHKEAVEATSGRYLMYNSTLTYGFYVAGDSTLTPPECVGNLADAATEKWVTYNEGRAGAQVEQTDLGLVIPEGDPSYGQNRGCMSQWGARCLENDVDYGALDILRFYYGDDIEIAKADGACVLEGGDTGVAGGSTGAGGDDGPGGTTGPDSGGDGDSGADAGGNGGGDATGPGGGPDADDSLGTGPQDTQFDPDDSALPGGYGAGRGEAGGCACQQAGPIGIDMAGVLLGLVFGIGGTRRRKLRA